LQPDNVSDSISSRQLVCSAHRVNGGTGTASARNRVAFPLAEKRCCTTDLCVSSRLVPSRDQWTRVRVSPRGCRSIPLTKRLPIAPAERVNRQPSFFPNYVLVSTFHHDWLTALVLASNVRLPRVRTSIHFLTEADQAASEM